MKKIILTLTLLSIFGYANAFNLEKENYYLANGYLEEVIKIEILEKEQEYYSFNGYYEDAFNKGYSSTDLINNNLSNGIIEGVEIIAQKYQDWKDTNGYWN